jgi:hypothetical protein
MGHTTVWLKQAAGWRAVRADRLHAVFATQEPGQLNPGREKDPERPVHIAVSTGLVDDDGEQQIRIGTCQAAYADESIHQLLTALVDGADADARFIVVAGESPGPNASTGGKTPRPGPVRWELHRDRWPVPPPRPSSMVRQMPHRAPGTAR